MGSAVVLIIVTVCIILYWIYRSFNSDDKVPDYILREKLKIENEQLRNRLEAEIANSKGNAIKMFQDFKEKEMENLKKEISVMAKKEAEVEFHKWKVTHTNIIRQEAIIKSKSVTYGKVAEHMVPFYTDFRFNPNEARFIGSPIDLIVFDGIDSDENDIVDIYLLEIKTGDSSLSKRQRRIREACINKRIHWRQITINEFGIMKSA